MSDSYGSRGPRNYDNNDCQIFVSGIPIDIDKGGLYNIFSKVGHVENIKIIPSKNPSHTTTFGFVRFKTKSSAAQAVEMFDGYKVGSKQLTVRISNTPGSNASSASTSNSNVAERKSSDCPTGSGNRAGGDCNGGSRGDDDWSQDEATVAIVKQQRTTNTAASTITTTSFTNVSALRDDNSSTRGRGRMIDASKPNGKDTASNASGDNARPRVDSRPNQKNSSGSESAYFMPVTDHKKSNMDNGQDEQLEVGKPYEVVVTQVKTPANFFIRVLNNQTISSNKQSFRCKLDMQPPKGEIEWSKDIIAAFEKFQNLDELITAEVRRVERLHNEPIHVVELYFGGEESVIEHFVKNKLAVKTVKNEEILSNSDSDWWRYDVVKKSTTQKYLQSLAKMNRKKRRTTTTGALEQEEEYEADTDGEDNDDNDEANNSIIAYSTNDGGVMIPSVSMGDLNLVGECDHMGRINQETFAVHTVLSSTHAQTSEITPDTYRNHVAPMSRNKMFNGLFKIWKKRDINPIIQKYKCGQVLNVRISHLGDSATFYTHEYRRLNDLMTVEASIQNYARVLLNSEELRNELLSFQHNAAKNDLVLARSSWDGHWRRAVIMERESSENLAEEQDDYQADTYIPANSARIFHTFFMIDWGRTDTYLQTAQKRGELFMLPMNAKLLAIGAFALKCSINQCHVRFRETLVPNPHLEELNAERKREFEAAFRARLKDEPLLKMRITQVVNIKNDVQAIVELYYFPDEKMIEVAGRKHHDVLNCVKSILDELNYLNVNDYEREFGGDDTRYSSDEDESSFISHQATPQEMPAKTTLQSLIPNKENVQERKEEVKQTVPILPKQQQKNQPLVEQDLNKQQTTTLQPATTKSPKINFAQLDAAKSNTVMFQYEEESHEHFFVALKDQFENLALLQLRLQEEGNNEKLFSYITSINQVKTGDHLEALFDQDATWYRVSVIKIDEAKRAVDVYFVDYGNTQRFENLADEKKLRRRNLAIESDENKEILSLDYQAIKCFYYSTHSGQRERNDLFLEKLADLDIEQGVKIRVVETKLDSLSKTSSKPNICYGIDLDEEKFDDVETAEAVATVAQQMPAQKKSTAGSSVSTTDREVRQIFESSKPTADTDVEIKVATITTKQSTQSIQSTKSVVSCTKYSIFSMRDLIPKQPRLRADQLPQKVLIVLLEDLDEFYVQVVDEQTEHFAEQDQRIKDLCRNMNKKKAANGVFEIGDLVYAQFIDSEWYRAIVVGKSSRTPGAGGGGEVLTTDLDETYDSSVFLTSSHNASAMPSSVGLTYDVHFIDYGNRHTILCAASELCSIETLIEQARANGCEESVRETIALPIQAHCCRLDSSIARTSANLETLQKLASTESIYDVVRVSSLDSCELIAAAVDGDRRRVEMFKYTVSLEQDGQLIDDMLEKTNTKIVEEEKSKPAATDEKKPTPIEKPQTQPVAIEKPKIEEKSKVINQATSKSQTAMINLNSNELKNGQIYQCKLADINMETGVIFVNLLDDANKQSQLESALKAIVKVPSSAKLAQPSVGDVVLAKYYVDENRQQYSWYRAVIDSKDASSGCFGVLYIDYGNRERGLDAAEMDMVRIPEKYSLKTYSPPFAYKIRLANVPGFSLDEHAALLEEFLIGVDENHTFNIRVVAREAINQDVNVQPDLVAYDVELWTADNAKCLNAIIRRDEKFSDEFNEVKPPSTKPIATATPPASKPALSSRINESSLNAVVKDLPTTLKCHMMFLSDFEKPIFFTLTSDMEKQEGLMSQLNDFCSSSSAIRIDNITSLKVDSYVAALSEGNWYRVRVKSVDTETGSCSVFFVDYGYEDVIAADDMAERVRTLDPRFFDEPRLAFGALLSARDHSSHLVTSLIDTDALQAIVESFFTTGDSKEILNIKIVNSFNKPELLANETFYLIEMRNEANTCLNDLFEKVIKEKKPTVEKSKIDVILKKTPSPPPPPPKRPIMKPLKLADIPQQKTLAQLNKNKTEQYVVFSRSIDLFYVFSTNVELIQTAVQQTCKEMLEELGSFADYKEDELDRRPQVGDLVFGQYELDGAWYRCVVTNCDKTRTNYEVFYIDFGNTELASYSSSSLLVPWRESHTRVFHEYEPQAYKCCLYGLRRRRHGGNENDGDNEKFKTFAKNRLFSVRFLNENSSDGLFGACLDEIISDSKISFATAHVFVIKEKLGDFLRFDEIVESVRTSQEIDFYVELLKNYKSLKDTA